MGFSSWDPRSPDYNNEYAKHVKGSRSQSAPAVRQGNNRHEPRREHTTTTRERRDVTDHRGGDRSRERDSQGRSNRFTSQQPPQRGRERDRREETNIRSRSSPAGPSPPRPTPSRAVTTSLLAHCNPEQAVEYQRSSFRGGFNYYHIHAAPTKGDQRGAPKLPQDLQPTSNTKHLADRLAAPVNAALRQLQQKDPSCVKLRVKFGSVQWKKQHAESLVGGIASAAEIIDGFDHDKEMESHKVFDDNCDSNLLKEVKRRFGGKEKQSKMVYFYITINGNDRVRVKCESLRQGFKVKSIKSMPQRQYLCDVIRPTAKHDFRVLCQYMNDHGCKGKYGWINDFFEHVFLQKFTIKYNPDFDPKNTVVIDTVRVKNCKIQYQTQDFKISVAEVEQFAREDDIMSFQCTEKNEVSIQHIFWKEDFDNGKIQDIYNDDMIDVLEAAVSLDDTPTVKQAPGAQESTKERSPSTSGNSNDRRGGGGRGGDRGGGDGRRNNYNNHAGGDSSRGGGRLDRGHDERTPIRRDNHREGSSRATDNRDNKDSYTAGRQRDTEGRRSAGGDGNRGERSERGGGSNGYDRQRPNADTSRHNNIDNNSRRRNNDDRDSNSMYRDDTRETRGSGRDRPATGGDRGDSRYGAGNNSSHRDTNNRRDTRDHGYSREDNDRHHKGDRRVERTSNGRGPSDRRDGRGDDKRDDRRGDSRREDRGASDRRPPDSRRDDRGSTDRRDDRSTRDRRYPDDTVHDRRDDKRHDRKDDRGSVDDRRPVNRDRDRDTRDNNRDGRRGGDRSHSQRAEVSSSSSRTSHTSNNSRLRGDDRSSHRGDQPPRGNSRGYDNDARDTRTLQTSRRDDRRR